MKKVILSGVAMIALATATLFTTSSCKKDEVVAPIATVPAVNFNSALTKEDIVLTSNRAAGFATNSLGSFYSIASKTTGNSSLANSDFKLFDTNTTSTGTATMTLSNSGATNATLFGTTTLSYTSATGQNVSDATAPASASINITAGTTYLFVTSAGKKGLIYVDALTDATVTAGGSTKNASIKLKVVE